VKYQNTIFKRKLSKEQNTRMYLTNIYSIFIAGQEVLSAVMMTIEAFWKV